MLEAVYEVLSALYCLKVIATDLYLSDNEYICLINTGPVI